MSTTRLGAGDTTTLPLTTPGSFRVSTQLMQDVLPADEVSVGSGANQEALFSNPFKEAREEALVINSAGLLTYLERTSSSDTGWRQAEVATVGGATFAEVVVAVHMDGDVWAFCSPKDAAKDVQSFVLTPGATQPDGTTVCSWTARPATADPWRIGGKAPQALAVSYSPDAGPLVMGSVVAPMPIWNQGLYFGALSPGLMNAANPSGHSDWVASAYSAWPGQGSGRVAGGGFVPASQLTANTTLKNYVFYLLAGGELARSVIQPGVAASMPTVLSSTVKHFCGTWNVPNLPQAGPQGDVGYVYLDTQNDDLVTGYGMPGQSGIEIRTPALGFEDGAVWQDADKWIHVFGENSDGALQVLHQDNWATNNGRVLPVWATAVGDLPNGIGGYDLAASDDRLFPYDWDGTGHADHLVLYRPSENIAWVVGRQKLPEGSFAKVFDNHANQFQSVLRKGDQFLAYDYNGTGRADFLVLYHAAERVIEVMRRQNDGFQTFWTGPVSPDIVQTADTRIFGFDFAGTGSPTHLVLYTPGQRSVAILASNAGWGGGFKVVYNSGQNGAGNGIGSYDMADGRDQLIAYDYTGSGCADHLVAYRPGVGTVWILQKDSNQNNANLYTAIYTSSSGIGGFLLNDSTARLTAYGYGDRTIPSNLPDRLLACKPGAPGMYVADVRILQRQGDPKPGEQPTFEAVYLDDDFGGYYPTGADQFRAYDYDGDGHPDHMIIYRPGAGVISIFRGRSDNLFLPVFQAPSRPTPVTVGLHPDITAYQMDPYPDYKPSQLIKMSGVTPAEAYCLCTQDVTTSAWATDKVRLDPSADTKATSAHLVDHYLANATLLDTSGCAMPDHPVTVTADSLVEVRVSDLSYQVGPGRPALVSTDGKGRLVIAVDAKGLDAAVVYLTTDGMSSGAAIDFAAPLNDYLAGTGTLRSQPGKFDEAALKGATCTNADGTTSPLVADWDTAPLDAATVVKHCENAYGAAAGSPPKLTAMIDGYDEPQPIVGYAVQTWDPTRPSFHVFRTREELEAYQADRTGHGAYGGFWDSATSWAGDIWEGVKTGATAVADFVASTGPLGQFLVDIAVWVGDTFVSLGEMVIDALESAVQAVQAVFQMIADAVTRVIDWLKSLFDFGDIWDTKTALQAMIEQVPDAGKKLTAKIGELGAGFFDQQKTRVHLALDGLRGQFGTTKAGDFQNIATPPTTSQGDTLDAASFKDDPDANWAMNKFVNSSSLSVDVDLSGGSPTGDWLLPEALAVCGVFGDTVLDLCRTVVDAVGGVFASPDTMAQAGLGTVLDVVERLVDVLLDFCADLTKGAVKLVDAFLDGIAGLLDFELPLGPIVWLWDWLMAQVGHPEEKLTVANLGALLLAYPITIVYKVVFGTDRAPFPGGAAMDFSQWLTARTPAQSTGATTNAAIAVPAWPDGYSCAAYNVTDGVVIAVVYNLLSCMTNWDDFANITWISLLYCFLAFVAFCALYLPFAYSNNIAWIAPCGIWFLDAAFNTASVLLGARLPISAPIDANTDSERKLLKNRGVLGAAAGTTMGLMGLVATAGCMISAPIATDGAPLALAWASGILGAVSTVDAFIIPIASKFADVDIPGVTPGIVSTPLESYIRVGKTVLDALANGAAGICTIAAEVLTIEGGLAVYGPDCRFDDGVKWFGPQSTVAVAWAAYDTKELGYVSKTKPQIGIYYKNTDVSILNGGSQRAFHTGEIGTLPAGLVRKYTGTPDLPNPVFCGIPTTAGESIWGVALTDNSYPPFNAMGALHAECTEASVTISRIAAVNHTVTVPVSTLLADRIKATVTDATGAGVDGAGVSFVSVSGASAGIFRAEPDSIEFVLGADRSSIQVAADRDGVADSYPFLAGAAKGTYTINATVPGVTAAGTAAITCVVTDSPVAKIALTGDQQSANPGQLLTKDLIAQLLNAAGAGVADTLVTFDLAAGAGVFVDPSARAVYFDPAKPTTIAVLTDAGGYAPVSIQAGTTPGGHSVQIQVPGGARITGTFTISPDAELTALSGDGQSQPVTFQFENLVAKVTNHAGAAVSGISVTFVGPDVADGRPSCVFGAAPGTPSVTVTTDDQGLADSGPVFANGYAGAPYVASAGIAGIAEAAHFALTNTAAQASSAVPSGGNSQWSGAGSAALGHRSAGHGAPGVLHGGHAGHEGHAGHAIHARHAGHGQHGEPVAAPVTLRLPLQVTVLDVNGNPVPGRQVAFTAPPAGGPSCEFAGGVSPDTYTATTDANGEAKTGQLIPNGKTGRYSVTATVLGTAVRTTFALGTSGDPAKLWAGNPDALAAHTAAAFITPPSARVMDQNGNPVPGVSVTFTLPTTPGAPSGTFPGGKTTYTGQTSDIAPTAGLVTAPPVTANGVAGTWTIAVAVGSLNTVIDMMNTSF